MNALEVRIEGSPAAALALGEVALEPDTVYTLFVIGTPVGAEPLEVLPVGTRLSTDPATGEGQGQPQDQQEGGSDGN
jgi:hypothetical protein